MYLAWRTGSRAGGCSRGVQSRLLSELMREVLPSTEKTATGAANVRTTGVLEEEECVGDRDLISLKRSLTSLLPPERPEAYRLAFA